MGQEVRMRRVRFLVLLIFFIVCFSVAFAIVSSRRQAVTRMFNDAGRDGNPIVFFQYKNQYPIENYLASLGHRPIKLFTRSMGQSLWVLFFSSDGALHMVSEMPVIDTYEHWTINFPEIHLIRDDEWGADFFWRFPDAGVPLTGSTHQQIISAGLDHYRILDLEIGNITTGDFVSTRPWSISHYRTYSSEDCKLSPDGRYIVTRENVTTDLWNIWKYDIQESVWTNIIEKQDGYILNVGPEAKIIGLGNFRTSPEYTVFFDGLTGEAIHTVQNSTSSFIGDRWIVCQPYPGKSDLIFIDMEDDWKEYRITLPTDNVLRMAVYTPPPGGVEEMLRMREEMGE